MFLELIIAKVLALTDSFLGYFATVSEDTGSTIGLGNCALAINADVVTLTDCGNALIQSVAGLVMVGLAGLMELLPGIFAEA